ncbi:gastric triacylglycerol lipase-like isoform X2 [Anneissia japonica]|uniref:gastric triacylglycerol lipase-like isoform X2 n=1 Tax=Anneissia japonica TaxID=1529436 RepID=UPI0014255C2E|nr:gastric triacylglycerol lipase-like isoform X2 [Anneissia japonica]
MILKRKWMLRLFASISALAFILWIKSSGSEKQSLSPPSSKENSLRKLTQQLNTLSTYLPLDEIARQLKNNVPNISCSLNSPDKDRKLKFDPDTRLNVSGLISNQGYPVEEYSVLTEDGFILGIQRIPHGRSNKYLYGPRHVVFLQHGLEGSATNWVENQANDSLGFLLADAGFDVWLGNVRGNTYSLKHRTLKPTDKEFWKWSWDEMALYDLPAMVNFALNISNQQQLFYVGHSQGTLIAFAALSKNRDLNRKVKMFFALAPVTTVSNMSSPIRFIADYGLAKPIVDAFIMLHIYSFLPDLPIFNVLGDTICDNDNSVILCRSVIFVIAGYDCQRMNQSRIQVYVSNNPAGTSLFNLNHFAQMVLSGEFSMYDHGMLGNLLKYKQARPPNYIIENIQTPVAIFWGENDILADPTDVRKLRSKLKNLVYDSYIEHYHHLDFIWSVDAADAVYKDIIKLMNKHI